MLSSVVSFFCSDFSPILVPLQSAMTVTLPSGAGSHHDHNPFPGSLACIVGFEDTVSNAKPVNMVIYFTIGHLRVPLCLCFKASLSAKPFI